MIKSNHLPSDRIMAALTIAALLVVVSLLALCVPATPRLWAGDKRLPVYGYRVVNVYPHDRYAFTQGLIYRDGFLYESTGLNGRSSIRKVRLETGEVLDQRFLERQHFGEGLTEWGGKLLQLTWTSNVGFIYDRITLQRQGTFSYRREGWGLTCDRDSLIMSDGTATLRLIDPRTFRETGALNVNSGGVPLAELNELEFVRGEIFANIYRTDRIARLSLRTGEVTGWIDLNGLLPEADRRIPVDVLNGIAYDARRDRFFVTGKLWPKLFEIELVRRRQQP